MRLPLTDPHDSASIDLAELSRMVDRFLAGGFTYFDTAYTYHDGHAETALRRALVERYPRDAYELTDKLPTLLIEDEAQQERIFAEQLERCAVDRFDRYLVHCATRAFYEQAERMHSFDFAARMKREGLARQIGFSFHDTPELLETILERYPETDFVQLQISYVDWEYTPIQAHRCYEVARRFGKPIVAMCPLKGGLLADVPPEVERIFRAYAPDRSPASWALRFAASREGVFAVLSGMSSLAQVEENAAFMERFEALDGAERLVVEEAAEALCRTAPIQCTACGYCLPTCPQRIPIPDELRLYNADTAARHARFEERLAEYAACSADRGRASECIACGRCEAACPQHLRIIGWMKRIAELFEPKQEPLHA